MKIRIYNARGELVDLVDPIRADEYPWEVEDENMTTEDAEMCAWLYVANCIVWGTAGVMLCSLVGMVFNALT